MKISLYGILASIAFSIGLAITATAWAQGIPKSNKRTEFMRQKLEFSKNVLEGLANENFDLIAKNAKGLKLLSQAAEWEVPFIPNVDQYLPYTLDFQRIADDLAQKAKDRNLDGATLAFSRMTMNCVDCHKYVRGFAK